MLAIFYTSSFSFLKKYNYILYKIFLTKYYYIKKVTLYIRNISNNLQNGGLMLVKKLLVSGLLIMILSTSFAYNTLADSNEPPKWSDWKYRQEIKLPIETCNSGARYQPIDIQVEFRDPCWAKDNEEHSIRVLCWDGKQWHPLELQIYNLEYIDQTHTHIKKCNVIFLVPDIADGNERYFVYYDSDAKSKPNYVDHVSIEDSYYYYEPISGVSVEGDYYKIIEDGYIVYGIGQKGKAINRCFSQVVLKQKPETKEFGLLGSEILASFSFSYHAGPTDEYERSSDQKLVSKEISIDGNLMVEFKIVSESDDGNLITTNSYRYYYCPTDVKRISVHVRHHVLNPVKVSGLLNADGRYAALFSFKSTSEKLKKMRFGEILPYLHVAGDDGSVKEYNMILNPEEKTREWLISYLDDCDVGKGAWVSYDEGNKGEAQAIIFSSNENIVKLDTKGERDGIQVKVAEKEILDAIGAEIDYANVNLGRNSYEKNGVHDLDIPGDFFVEYNAEFFTSENGGYDDVIKEADYFQTLIKHRQDVGGGTKDENIYTLTVTPRLTGRFFSDTSLLESLGLNLINLTYIYAELYQNNKIISTNYATKPLIGAPKIKFPKLAAGEYIVKIFRKIGDKKTSFIGLEPVKLDSDADVNVVCTWPKNIKIKTIDQNNKYVGNIRLSLYKNDTVVATNITKNEEDAVFNVPFNLLGEYVLRGFYKGFKIYDDKIPKLRKNVNIQLELYDLTTNVKDTLGFSPGVNLRPYLTSSEQHEKQEILPSYDKYGTYRFKDLPPAVYVLHLSYASFHQETNFNIYGEGNSAEITFPAKYDLSVKLLNSRGLPISDDGKNIDIYRDGQLVVESLSDGKIVSLPPAEYTVYVESGNKGIGIHNLVLTNNKEIKVVTTEKSIIPLLVIILTIILIVQMTVVFIIKRISLNSFLKLLAMAFIVLSLIQPWWVLNASTNDSYANKNSEMFLIPSVMVEDVKYGDSTYLELATIPDAFTDFLGVLLLIVSVGFVLIGISFLPNLLYKRRFYKALISMSILFLILVSVAYCFGMSKITEISLGTIQGGGVLEVILPNEETVYMHATWGLGLGFYFCILSALTALSAGISDFIRRKWNKN